MTTVLRGNSVWWVCSCNQLRTCDPKEAFLHRQDFHIVKPISFEELAALPAEVDVCLMTGIERMEIEALVSPIPPDMVWEWYSPDARNAMRQRWAAGDGEI